MTLAGGRWARTAVSVLIVTAAGLGQTPEAVLRTQALEGTLQKFNADLQREGNGSYEAWAAKLAPLREYWVNRALQRSTMSIADFESPDHFSTISLRSILGDPTMRLDYSEPLHQIVQLNHQLKAKGIDLIFAMTPSSLEVFPEKFVDNPQLLPPDGVVTPYRRRFLHLLADAGVEVVDLVDVLRTAKSSPDSDQLTLKHDYHLSNYGVVLAAQAISERLRRYDFVKAALPTASKYTVRELQMEGLGQSLKLWPVQMPDGQMFEPAQSSPILCIGDSNVQVYGSHNPAKDWLPNGPDHADFAAQLSRFTGVRVSLLSVQAFTPDMLNREPVATWAGRRVVVWISDGARVVPALPWGQVQLQPAASPKLLLPAPGTVLSKASGGSVTFSWNALPEAQDYWLDVGLSPGKGDIFGGFTGGTTSKTIDLERYLDGHPIYVGLFSKFYDLLIAPGVRTEFKTKP
jgi:SGNH hydrolase-like domain, acetyltransferase AlgX